jgi:hypothetical protein
MREALTLFHTDDDGWIVTYKIGILMRSLGGNPRWHSSRTSPRMRSSRRPLTSRASATSCAHLCPKPFDCSWRDALRVLDKESVVQLQGMVCSTCLLILFCRCAQVESAEARARVAKLGLHAVLAYGLFVLAFLGCEKSTSKNPVTNLKALLGVCSLLIGIICRIFQFGAAHNKCELGTSQYQFRLGSYLRITTI